MPEPDIYSLSLDELARALVSFSEPAFRAKQIFDWLYVKKVHSFALISSLPKPLRDKLSEGIPFPVLKETARYKSADGTVKFVFELHDGQHIETVFIPTAKRGTLCLSSQAGCKFSCRFCASGLHGFRRDLTTGEIMAEVLAVMRAVAPKPVTHIVFMGTGEPFDNYDQVFKAIRSLNAKEGINIAARRITLSTCGIIPGIERMGTEGLQIELCVSLHAPNDAIRSTLMPINKKYPLKALLSACRQYARATGRQVTFEYILIKDLTCTRQAAEELSRLMKGWLAKVNLIVYNPVKEFTYSSPPASDVRMFQGVLEAAGVTCTLRSARGDDVSAACGQLRNVLSNC